MEVENEDAGVWGGGGGGLNGAGPVGGSLCGENDRTSPQDRGRDQELNGPALPSHLRRDEAGPKVGHPDGVIAQHNESFDMSYGEILLHAEGPRCEDHFECQARRNRLWYASLKAFIPGVEAGERRRT